jgi:hypothetical protein
MSIALAQAASPSIEPTTIKRMMIRLTLSRRDYGVAAGGSGMICTLSPSAKFTGGCSTT